MIRATGKGGSQRTRLLGAPALTTMTFALLMLSGATLSSPKGQSGDSVSWRRISNQSNPRLL
jgi:hypothetical protein